MILTPDGEVLTNNHVVAGASSVTVTLFGQTKALPAHVVGTDPSDDLALVQIDHASDLPPSRSATRPRPGWATPSWPSATPWPWPAARR